MIKKVLLFTFIITSISINAQKAQRIGYIDMEYILENVPEYTEAQSKIDAKAIVWQSNIEKHQKEIEDLKAELNNEKVLLTDDLIIEKEEDIQILEFDLKNLQVNYFGTNGDLYFLRQQLVQPIQDLVYNAIQDIAIKRRYDFILEKSTSLIMLYSNKKYDVSDLVIKNINREKKTSANKAKQGKGVSEPFEKATNEESQKRLTDREIKQALLKKKIEDKKAAQLKKRKELKAAIEAKRQKRIQEIEDAKKAKEKKRNN